MINAVVTSQCLNVLADGVYTCFVFVCRGSGSVSVGFESPCGGFSPYLSFIQPEITYDLFKQSFN